MANYRDDFDRSSQWASVGQSSWSTPVETLEDQADQWQGRVGQYHTLRQIYYGSNGPQAWRQGAYRGSNEYALDNVEIDCNKQTLQELESYLELFDEDTEAEAQEYLERAEFETAHIDYAFDNVD